MIMDIVSYSWKDVALFGWFVSPKIVFFYSMFHGFCIIWIFNSQNISGIFYCKTAQKHKFVRFVCQEGDGCLLWQVKCGGNIRMIRMIKILQIFIFTSSTGEIRKIHINKWSWILFVRAGKRWHYSDDSYIRMRWQKFAWFI